MSTPNKSAVTAPDQEATRRRQVAAISRSPQNRAMFAIFDAARDLAEKIEAADEMFCPHGAGLILANGEARSGPLDDSHFAAAHNAIRGLQWVLESFVEAVGPDLLKAPPPGWKRRAA